MPIYEYHCGACGHRFTEYSRKVVASNEEAACPPCPACLSGATQRALGSFILQGSAPGQSPEAAQQNQRYEREAQTTPREQIEAYRKAAKPEQR